MSDSNQMSNGAGDEPRDPAENSTGMPDAGSGSSGAPGESASSPAGATASESTSEQQDRVEALKAKIAALKAQKGSPDAPAATTAAAPGAAAPAVAAPAVAAASASAVAGAAPAAAAATGDADKEAKLAEMRAKIEAAKAGKAAPAAAPAAATPSAPAAAAPAAAPKPASAPRPPAPKSPFAKAPEPAKGQESGVWYFGRRNFMQSIGWMSFFGFFSIMILGTLRAMFPRVIYEKPPVFKAGFPDDYVPGTVSELYKDEQRVWIIRQTDGSFIGLLAICTHLGCTPRWLAAENKFKCPCHGSGFRGTPTWGVNFEGPAPRPLERLAIHLAPDGQIEIDKSKKFLWEKGEWENPEATLKA